MRMGRQAGRMTVSAVSLDELLAEVWKELEDGGNSSEKVLIKADPHKIEEQRRDMRIIENLIDEMKNANCSDIVFIRAAIAVGYANAMQIHGIIKEKELKQLNALIGTIGERRLEQIEKLEHRRMFERIMRFGKAVS